LNHVNNFKDQILDLTAIKKDTFKRSKYLNGFIEEILSFHF